MGIVYSAFYLPRNLNIILNFINRADTQRNRFKLSQLLDIMINSIRNALDNGNRNRINFNFRRIRLRIIYTVKNTW